MIVAILSWCTERKPALKVTHDVFPCCAKSPRRSRRPSFDRIGRHEKDCPLCHTSWIVDVTEGHRVPYVASWTPVAKTVAA